MKNISILENEMNMMRFFNESTTEHEQDGFIAWMCANFNNSLDTHLQRLSKKFIDFLITPSGRTSFVADYQVVKVERQKYKIDVLLTLKEGDSTHYVIIEDKIDSQEHGDQLKKYVERLKKEKGISKERILVVYYKTGHIIKSDEELFYDKGDKVWKTKFAFGEYHRVLSPKGKVFVGVNIIDLKSINVFFRNNTQLVSDCNNAIVRDYADYINGRYKQISSDTIDSDSPVFVWIKAFDDFVCGVKKKKQFHNSLKCRVTSFTANDPELQITWSDETDGECCKYPVMCIHSKDLCLKEPFIRFQNKQGAKDAATSFVNPINSRNGDQIMKYGFQHGQFSNNALNSITVNGIHALLTEICNRYCDVVSGKANNFYL